jgi:hypothetical protein
MKKRKAQIWETMPHLAFDDYETVNSTLFDQLEKSAQGI